MGVSVRSADGAEGKLINLHESEEQLGKVLGPGPRISGFSPGGRLTKENQGKCPVPACMAQDFLVRPSLESVHHAMLWTGLWSDVCVLIDSGVPHC